MFCLLGQLDIFVLNTFLISIHYGENRFLLLAGVGLEFPLYVVFIK